MEQSDFKIEAYGIVTPPPDVPDDSVVEGDTGDEDGETGED